MKRNWPILVLCLFTLVISACLEPPREIEYISGVKGRTIHTVVGNSTELPVMIDGDSVKTFILIRHAEKGTGEDPPLTTEGRLRAVKLASLLKEMPIDLVFSSPYNRTIATVEPLASSRGLDYAGYQPDQLEQLVDAIFADRQAKNVIISGHSNTTPSLLNLLVGEERYQQIPEDDYENIYFLVASQTGKAEVYHFLY